MHLFLFLEFEETCVVLVKNKNKRRKDVEINASLESVMCNFIYIYMKEPPFMYTYNIKYNGKSTIVDSGVLNRQWRSLIVSPWV